MTPRFNNFKLWLLAFVIVTFTMNFVKAQQKFHCDGNIFLSSVDGIDQSTTLYYLGKYSENWSLNPFSNKNQVQINAIGFSAKDSLIYGIEPTKHQLFSIDATGKAFFIDYIPLQGNYYAGDVSPDGKELVLFRTDSLAFIDLETHQVRYQKTSSTSGSNVFCTDIAFDFMSGLLYGYDAVSTRLVIINPETGLIDNNKYQEIGYYSSIPALFFNEYGELYGIGTDFTNQSSFIYHFDLVTGSVSQKPFDFFVGERDACSCPSGIRLISQTDNSNYLPCSEIQFTYVVSNYSNSVANSISFHEVYPEGFAVVGIENNLGGTLVTSVNSNKISIENINIPKGIDTLIVTVSVPKDANGDYQVNPILVQADGSTIKADNPLTPEKNDIIKFRVDDLQADLTKFYSDTLEICDEAITIDLPFFRDLKYEWSNGDSIPSIEIFESGHYEVTLTSICETSIKVFDVIESDLDVEIENTFTIDAGNSLVLSPLFDSNTPIIDLNWTAIPPDPSICGNCPSIHITPQVDTRYILQVQNSALCMKYIEIDIIIDRNIFAPNAFTPNFDGINDMFFISSSGSPLEIKQLSIYDRWGGIVFENTNIMTNSISDGWNGLSNGKTNPSGIYVWMAEIITPEGYSILKQGTITILER